MARAVWSDRIGRGLAVLVLLIGSAARAQQGATTAPASMSAYRSAAESRPVEDRSVQADVASRRAAALDDALAGRFEKALAELHAIVQAGMDDPLAREAHDRIQAYLKRKTLVDEQRRNDYEYEIERIRWANLAQKHLEEFQAKPFCKDVRKLIKKRFADAYHDVGTADGFEEASADEARTMKETSLQKIDEAESLVRQAVEKLGGAKGPYFDEFRSEAQVLLGRLRANRQAWAAADPGTARGRWEAARKLEVLEERLADAVTDLEVLVSKKPWKIALLHGQLAKKMAPNAETVAKELWYRDMIADAERRGKDAMAEADWYDALAAYSALEELEPDNETYRDENKTVIRHVRVLRLYGPQKDLDATDDEEDDLPETIEQEDAVVEEADGPVWKELVEGVDADMVRKAVSRIGRSYVQAVDYRKLTRGALQSLKVLVQTPQVRETFPGLKDQAKREAFIASLNKELSDIEKPDHVRPLDLMRTLNNVLDRSEETVNLPVEVLSVEFADGFLNELDKFSTMIWPSEITNFNKSTMGQFTGIGVQITKERGEPLKVVSPLLDTPAMKAGIKAGDLITAVDGADTKTRSIDKLIKMIMGPPNTTVTLTIKRRGVPEEFDVPVIRQAVNIRTVNGWRRRGDGRWDYRLLGKPDVAYVRITQFTGTTIDDVKDALRQMRDAGVRSLILDLRANPGGLLPSATDVADEFLAEGDIVSTRGRQVPRTYKRARDSGLFLDGDLVVLVDQNSASAAEILSGALKDLKRAVIVGQRSYGKGSVQNVIPVRDDEAYLKLTTAYYYLPSNRLLHRKPGAKDWGVNPDVDVYVTPRQMRRLLQIRRKTDLLQEFDPELLRADLKRQYQADAQLDTALLILELLRLKHAEQDVLPVSEGVAAEG
ncbi:MAG: S41 family peptidase [Phycisphaerae bacterium]|nr:S41 family peptidase [Phycisphaerae bacterium]